MAYKKWEDDEDKNSTDYKASPTDYEKARLDTLKNLNKDYLVFLKTISYLVLAIALIALILMIVT